MITDMNQYLLFRKFIGMLNNYCKKNDSLSAKKPCAGQACSQFVLTEHICSYLKKAKYF